MNKIFEDHNLDVIVSLAYQTRLWYAKIKTSEGYIFIENNRADLIVDGRYITYARQHAQNVDVHLYKKRGLKEFAQGKNYKRIGIEKDYLTINQFELINKMFPQAKFIKIKGQDLRVVKSQEEIANIKQACVIALTALASIQDMIKAGTEEVAIDQQLNLKMKALGADKEAFDAIVVSGSRGALPHGCPTTRRLQEGELVTIDFGAYYKGFASDITRTFKVGQVNDQKMNDILTIVKAAQKKGIAAIKPGVTSSAIDKTCRDYITKKGYGQYFVHSTGHGLGIDVHELPYIKSKNNKVLKAGMVVTVEPGIYIEGWGGVRIEDDVLVTKNGYEVLSQG